MSTKKATTPIPKKLIDELVKFLKESIEDLTSENSNTTVWWFDPEAQDNIQFRVPSSDFDLVICLGWSDGYDENDKSAIHAKDDPSYCINAAVKIRNPYEYEYDSLDFPYNDEECWDTTITIRPNNEGGLRDTAKWLLSQYVAMAEASLEDNNTWVFQ